MIKGYRAVVPFQFHHVVKFRRYDSMCVVRVATLKKFTLRKVLSTYSVLFMLLEKLMRQASIAPETREIGINVTTSSRGEYIQYLLSEISARDIMSLTGSYSQQYPKNYLTSIGGIYFRQYP